MNALFNTFSVSKIPQAKSLEDMSIKLEFQRYEFLFALQ